MDLVVIHQHPVSSDELADLPQTLDGSQGINRLPQVLHRGRATAPVVDQATTKAHLRLTARGLPSLSNLPGQSLARTLLVRPASALLYYWVDAGYPRGNPLSLIRRRNKKLTPQANEAPVQERSLDQETWNYLKAYIAALPQDNRRQIEHYERTRFLFHFLYLLAPRVLEVASHSMNSFREYRGRWW